jgi:hypothetical protein
VLNFTYPKTKEDKDVRNGALVAFDRLELKSFRSAKYNGQRLRDYFERKRHEQ